MIKIEYLEDDESLYEEETKEETEDTYGTKEELDIAVDNDDMEAEDALFLKGYLEEDEE